MIPVSPEAFDLFLEGSEALSRMEANGIVVDTDYLDQAIANADREAAELAGKMRADPLYDEWRKAFGQRAKISAPDQITHVLFNVLKLPYPPDPERLGPKRLPDAYTDSGKLKSSDEVIAQVDLPFARDWSRHKKLVKLSSTFLKGLKREAVEGKLHPTFNLHTVVTYRSSSGGGDDDRGGGRGWNFQNLPVRNPEFAESIRRCFVPRKGRRLIENDFAALEFAGCGVYWADPELIAYASDPTKDIHGDMAAKLFKAPKPEVEKKTMRYIAKNQFVFPELYGSYWGQIAPRIWEALDKLNAKTVSGTPVKEWLKEKGINGLEAFAEHVKKCEEWFMSKFHVFANKKEDRYAEYRKKGEFQMLTGFVCRGLYTKNFIQNAPVQGMCFHWCLETIIKMTRLVEKRGMRAKLVGQIHDCIISDVPDDEVQDYLKLIKRVVSEHLPRKWPWITVPLKIEAEVTGVRGEPDGNWWSKKEWRADANGVWGPVKKD